MALTQKIPEMVKISEAAEMAHLPEHFVRTLVNDGKVAATRVGRKILVNFDALVNHLETNTLVQSPNPNATPREMALMEKPRIKPINRQK